MLESKNPFRLLRTQRFLPLFVTQFFGAFNDNLFKNALVILFAYECARNCEAYPFDSNTLVNLSTSLFIAPYFLFSALAGQLAERYPKHQLVRLIKLAEIIIVCLIGVGLYLNDALLLMGILFLLGTHSTFFGPIKYSSLPELLYEKELVAGNGLIEMGTFLAIIVGTISAGVLISIGDMGKWLTTAALLLFACIGYWAACHIPVRPPAHPALSIRFNFITETWSTLRLAAKNKVVFSCIICISWFWMYGAIFLTQLPNFNIYYLNGSETLLTLLLVIIAVGIGLGSVLCERLCQGRIEMGLVPFGAIGLTFFACDLGLMSTLRPEVVIGIAEFIHIPHSWHLMIDLFLLGIFSGIYTVPLYTLVQYKSEPKHRSRMIAANNIVNSIFMVLASVSAIVYFQMGLNIQQIFLMTGILTGVFSLTLFRWIPEYCVRFAAWCRSLI